MSESTELSLEKKSYFTSLMTPEGTEVWLHTCTIITGKSNELVAQIHYADASHPGRRASRRLVE
jgi:hypothetical protein